MENKAKQQNNKRSSQERQRGATPALSAYNPVIAQLVGPDNINTNNVDIVIQQLIERKRILAKETRDILETIKTLQLQKKYLK